MRVSLLFKNARYHYFGNKKISTHLYLQGYISVYGPVLLIWPLDLVA